MCACAYRLTYIHTLPTPTRVCSSTSCLHPAGAYDKGVSCLRSYHKEDMGKVAQDIFSHLYVKAKNTVVISLIVRKGGGQGGECGGVRVGVRTKG